MTRCVLETFQPTWRRTGFYRSFHVSTPPYRVLLLQPQLSVQWLTWSQESQHCLLFLEVVLGNKKHKSQKKLISVPHCLVRLVREWTLVSCKPFTVLLADEFNRVIIPVKRGEENTDYVNASFIDVSDGYVPWICPVGILVPPHIPAWEKHL